MRLDITGGSENLKSEYLLPHAHDVGWITSKTGDIYIYPPDTVTRSLFIAKIK